MSARFGFDLDLDPAGLSPDDLGVCRRAVEVYRSVRDLVQLGDLWRLVSPFVAVALAGDGAGGERAALAYVAPDATRAAVFAYQLEDGVPAAVPLAGLDAALTYAVHPIDLTGDEPPPSFAVPGADLLRDGLPWGSATAETAAIWLLGSTA
jgi:alpha-galactosidase